MKRYYYQCSQCGSIFPAEKIEQEFVYLCPNCGSAPKNEPLQGVLQVKYDYKSIAKNLSRETFLSLPGGKFWLYPPLWPLAYKTVGGKTYFENIPPEWLLRLALPADTLLEYRHNKETLWLWDDTRNPTLSYKDRASILIALKARQLNITEIAAASTGNAGSSLAGICARLGIKAHIFVPAAIPEAKRIQIQAFGAKIYMVKGDYDLAFDLCLEAASFKHWYNRNTAYNPLTIEGKKSAAYDMFISTGGRLPESIIIPVGDGVIISGLYKGFWELMQLGWIEKMPHLIAVQSTGSDGLVRYLQTGHFQYKEAKTMADSISAGAPRNLYMAAEAVRESQGRAIGVSDRHILSAQQTLAAEFGILCEPSSAAVLAAYRLLSEQGLIDPGSRNLLLITGNGLKDHTALQGWNPMPGIKSFQEWLDILRNE